VQYNKAFAIVGFVSDFGARYVVKAPDESVVAESSTFLVPSYSDTPQSIHQRLADQIRSQQDDPDLVVIFVDSPGRY
jgi:hypothetical protein